MKISVFFDHITQAMEETGRSLPELLAECRSYGIRGLEINYTHLKNGGAGLYRTIQDAGLAVSCIYEFYDFVHGTGLPQAKEHVDLAAEAGAEKVLIVPGFLEEAEARKLWDDCQISDNPSFRRVRDALRELVSYGKEKNVRITLEDFDGFTSPCSRMLYLKWFLEQVPGLGHTFDMGNYAYSDEDVEAAYELLHPYIVHVHCKDRGVEPQYRLTEGNIKEMPKASEGQGDILCRRYCQGLAGVAVGSGYLPVRKLVEQLARQGYDGYLAIEHFNVPGQMEHIRRSAEFLGSVCSSIA